MRAVLMLLMGSVLVTTSVAGCGGKKSEKGVDGKKDEKSGKKAYGSDPDKVDSQTAHEFAIAWVGNIGFSTEKDPIHKTKVRVRGMVVRVTPDSWINPPNPPRNNRAVWLRTGVFDWVYSEEILIRCEFEAYQDVADIKPGQRVAVEGIYLNDTVVSFNRCRLLAVGEGTERKTIPALTHAELLKGIEQIQAVKKERTDAFTIRDGLDRLHIDVRQKAFDEAGAISKDVVAKLAPLPIETMEVEGKNLTELLNVIKQFPRLTDLDIKGDIKECKPESLKVLGELPHLEALRFKGADEVTDEHVKVIASLENLRVLTLRKGFRRSKMTHIGFKELGRLKNLESLEVTTNDKIPVDALQAIAELPSLRYLSIRNASRAEDEGVVDSVLAECDATGFASLTFLRLYANDGITDATIERWKKQGRRFGALDLLATGVTDKGLNIILEEKMTDRFISLPDPDKTDAELKKKLVEANMIRDKG